MQRERKYHHPTIDNKIPSFHNVLLNMTDEMTVMFTKYSLGVISPCNRILSLSKYLVDLFYKHCYKTYLVCKRRERPRNK